MRPWSQKKGKKKGGPLATRLGGGERSVGDRCGTTFERGFAVGRPLERGAAPHTRPGGIWPFGNQRGGKAAFLTTPKEGKGRASISLESQVFSWEKKKKKQEEQTASPSGKKDKRLSPP